MLGRVIDPSKLHAHLNEITRLTKIAVSKLKEQELAGYLQKFKENSALTIQALIDLTYAHTPEKLVPLLNQLSNLYPIKQAEEPKSDST